MDTSPDSDELSPWFWGSWVPSVRTNEDNPVRGDPRGQLVTLAQSSSAVSLSSPPHLSPASPLRSSEDKSLMGLNLDQEQEEETKTVTAMV